MGEKIMKAVCKWACIALVLVIAGIAMADYPDYKSTPKSRVQGNYLEAWNVCWQDFLKEKGYNVEAKKLNGYDFYFFEDVDHIIISFAPIQTNEVITCGGDATYWIDKKSLKITRKDFGK
jgi:hypothetical protein